MESIKSEIFAIITKLQTALMDSTLYHIVAYILIFLIFVLLLTLAIMISRRTVVSSIIAMLSFLFLFISPFVSYFYINNIVRGVEFRNLHYKKLFYSDDIIVRGELKNSGKSDYQECLLTIDLVNIAPIPEAQVVFDKLPFLSETQTIKAKLAIGEIQSFSVSASRDTKIDSFRVFIGAECK